MMTKKTYQIEQLFQQPFCWVAFPQMPKGLGL